MPHYNNMVELWQNLASFGGRPIGGAIKALLIEVNNQQSSVLLIVALFVAAASSVSQPNGYSRHDALRV